MFNKLVPKSLFIRFILIILIPTIIAQLIAIYIFYNRHWYNVTNHMISSLVGEVVSIVRLRTSNDSLAKITDIEKELALYIHFIKTSPNKFKKLKVPRGLTKLHEALKGKIRYPLNVYYIKEQNEILIEISLPSGILEIGVSKNRVENPTTYIFILWMTGTNTLLVLLSLIFLKNQLRPIIKLARAAEQFGKGYTIENFKPEGALEVKKASVAFLKMKERIEKQIAQRTEMLIGVSHDLRTPLTRIKLQLALCKDEYARDIEDDLIEMEKMINAYIDFARGDGTEVPSKIFIDSFLHRLVHFYKKREIDIEMVWNGKVTLEVKVYAMQRALTNIVENAIKYATRIELSYLKKRKYLYIFIDDNGPGIMKVEREKVFRPFYRIENSRNKETGGIGLGLAIVRDIINSHGGTVWVQKSKKLGGLRVIIKLPC